MMEMMIWALLILASSSSRCTPTARLGSGFTAEAVLAVQLSSVAVKNWITIKPSLTLAITRGSNKLNHPVTHYLTIDFRSLTRNDRIGPSLTILNPRLPIVDPWPLLNPDWPISTILLTALSIIFEPLLNHFAATVDHYLTILLLLMNNSPTILLPLLNHGPYSVGIWPLSHHAWIPSNHPETTICLLATSWQFL